MNAIEYQLRRVLAEVLKGVVIAVCSEDGLDGGDGERLINLARTVGVEVKSSDDERGWGIEISPDFPDLVRENIALRQELAHARAAVFVAEGKYQQLQDSISQTGRS